MLILAGAALVPRPACASMEDAAIFYDELKQEGQWVDYGDYGPVWYPTQVQENWRPYVDGRWTPSEEGYVFEPQEPWAPETYHYGQLDAHPGIRLGLGAGAHLVPQHRGLADLPRV